MIIPWLKGILPFRLVPVTWAIVGINIFIFIVSLDVKKNDHPVMQTAGELITTGHLYYQFQNGGKTHLSVIKEDNNWLLYGSQALRDPKFVREATGFHFVGDQIEILRWKKSFNEFNFAVSQRFTNQFGLSFDHHGLWSWFTYQFTHAGWLHLIGNMMMLLIFGAIVEIKMGAGVLLLMFLVGGVFGGLGFFALSPTSLTPMVGASGSISAVMAFYLASERKRQVPCIYFLAPVQGFTGIINLPVWMLYPVCFLPDVAGYLSSPQELGAGVAYSAHIGGFLFGMSLGFLWKKFLFGLENRTDSSHLQSLLLAAEAESQNQGAS